MKIKKILLLIIIHCTMLKLGALSIEDVENIHQDEQAKVSEAISNLIGTLLSVETDSWIKNIKQTRALNRTTYPTLSSDEVKQLTTAIDQLKTKNERTIRTYNPTLPTKNSANIFKQIKESALNINQPTSAYTYIKQNYGFWKPITQRYLELVKAIIEAFGKQITKTALADMPPAGGETDHYFPQSNAGETLRKL